jgi:peptidase E
MSLTPAKTRAVLIEGLDDEDEFSSHNVSTIFSEEINNEEEKSIKRRDSVIMPKASAPKQQKNYLSDVVKTIKSLNTFISSLKKPKSTVTPKNLN